MLSDRLFGLATIALLVGFGATAVNVSVPSNPAASTTGIVDALTPTGQLLFAVFLLAAAAGAVQAVGEVY